MVISSATKICNALSAKKCEVPLDTSDHRAITELAKLLAILLAVDDCFLQCRRIPVRCDGRQPLKWKRCCDGRSRCAIEGEGL